MVLAFSVSRRCRQRDAPHESRPRDEPRRPLGAISAQILSEPPGLIERWRAMALYRRFITARAPALTGSRFLYYWPRLVDGKCYRQVTTSPRFLPDAHFTALFAVARLAMTRIRFICRWRRLRCDEAPIVNFAMRLWRAVSFEAAMCLRSPRHLRFKTVLRHICRIFYRLL